MTYEILETKIEALRKIMNKISKKCTTYGVEFHFEEIGETFKDIENEDGYTVTCRFIVVEAYGVAQINNWEFVASIDHLENGNVINKAFTDIEVPERYRTSAGICEHCNTTRYRKNTYIVHNTKTDEFKQVGKACLKDYTNGLDAAAAAALMEAKSTLEETENSSAGVSISEHQTYFRLTDFLQYVIETVKHFGYVSTSAGCSTKCHAADFFYLVEEDWAFSKYDRERLEKEIAKYNFKAFTPENEASAKSILDWLISSEDTSDFMHNLKTIAETEYISAKHFGYVAAMVPVYNKAHNNNIKKVLKTENTSEFQGTIGDKLIIDVDTCELLTSWGNQWGTTILYKILDKSGNIYIWKTSKLLMDLPVKSISGIIKAHNTYREEKQTELTRCRVIYDDKSQIA